MSGGCADRKHNTVTSLAVIAQKTGLGTRKERVRLTRECINRRIRQDHTEDHFAPPRASDQRKLGEVGPFSVVNL